MDNAFVFGKCCNEYLGQSFYFFSIMESKVMNVFTVSNKYHPPGFQISWINVFSQGWRKSTLSIWSTSVFKIKVKEGSLAPKTHY